MTLGSKIEKILFNADNLSQTDIELVRKAWVSKSVDQLLSLFDQTLRQLLGETFMRNEFRKEILARWETKK